MSGEDAVINLTETIQDSILSSDEVWDIIDKKLEADDRSYIQRNCRSKKDLKHFMKDFKDYIFIENDLYTSYNEELDEMKEKTAKYFQEQVANYPDYVSIIAIQVKLGGAPGRVKKFIDNFYRNDFRSFLKSRPDIFIVDGDSVHLIGRQSAYFFKEYLEEFGDGLAYNRVRGHIGHADRYIQNYINKNFLDSKFRDFLEQNNDIFKVDEKGRVYLVKTKGGFL